MRLRLSLLPPPDGQNIRPEFDRGAALVFLGKRKLMRNETDQMFLHAEQAGLKLAIIGRSTMIVLLGTWLIWSRASRPESALGFAMLLLVLIVLGAAHYILIATRFDRPWIKYFFVTLDIAILSALVATKPLFPVPELPQIMIFRAPIFPFYFVLLAVSALSLSPGMVLWAGLAGAAGWMGAFLSVLSGAEAPLDWDDVPLDPSAAEVTAIVLDPGFAGLGSRIQETLALLAAAAILAVVIAQARSTLRRQLMAERDRDVISRVFGQLVPETIANAMIANQGVLEPVEREATVLFADVVDFTRTVERIGAVRTVEMLNAYFDAATNIIVAHNGIVTEFLGDGFLATFNVPVEDGHHAEKAVDAARDILECVSSREFAGERLSVRIGINTGSLVAGNIGGGGRQSYTVYGDVVNIAARLEALNKEYGTSLLIADATARFLTNVELVAMGNIAVRGVEEPVTIYTLPL